MGRSAAWLAALLAALVLRPVAAGALTAPPGRAWTGDTTLTAPAFPFLVGPRLDFDATTGTLRLATSARNFGTADAFGFEWADSAWRQTWRIGAGTLRLWPVLSPPGTYHLVWSSLETSPSRATFHMAGVAGGQLQQVDTLASISVPQTECSAAVSPRRRWAAVGDYYGGMDNTLRMFYSDTVGSWHEVPVSGYANGGVSVGVLDDTTALVVWGGLDEGLEWATLRGTTWERGAGDPAYFGMYRIRVRPHPGGGHRVAWGMPRRYLALSHFANGAPGPVEWLDCNFPDPDIFFARTDTPDLSRDERERPVLAWGWSDIYGVLGICLCLPTESGYPVAEVVPNAWNAIAPTVAVDANGDVWLAWQQYRETVHWMHTYVTAVAAELAVTGSDSLRRVAWRLSEAAPGSRWTVLRGVGDELPVAVAGVAAGSGVELAWQDAAPLAERARYRVRRESLNRRYAWTSDEVGWDPATATGVALERIAVVEGRVELRWARHGRTVLEPRVERRTEVRIAYVLEEGVLRRALRCLTAALEAYARRPAPARA
uniref:LamG domain-containing protein n=1 Tax=Eiseniibacteriota bacterium TaxID=2212470 RepID=A0A832I5W6_UNCEI